MKHSEIMRLIGLVDKLDTKHYNQLKAVIEKRDSVKFVSRLLNDDSKNISCPYCKSLQLSKWGIRNDLQRYKCKSCKRTFNTLTGTPLAHLHKKGRWLSYAECIKKGMSIRMAADKCGVNKTTSFRWRHRFLANETVIKPKVLSGIVEVNELTFAWSDKGSRTLKRKARKRGYGASKYIPSVMKVFSLFCRDRGKNTFDNVYHKFGAERIKPELLNLISKDSLFCSLDKETYLKYTRDNKVRHAILSISKGELKKKDIVHINNILIYQNKLKLWMSRFNGVATKYLDNYLSWFRAIDEFDFRIKPETILLRAKRPEEYNTNHFSKQSG
ncbi:MAG: IS1595 family transposase [Bacteroidales bacterium]|jgi:transposase-like protein|nr:IS1595 family transposase [Bacteroidales bacterium]